jgi:hypothetical protein
MKAGVPYYGAAAVPAIEASLLIQYAGNDDRINAMWPACDTALPGRSGEVVVGTDRRVLQENAGLTPLRRDQIPE